MVTEPVATPVTTPVAAITVALAMLLLLQVPPLVASVSVIGEPLTDTLDGPPIEAGADGSATTLISMVARQPVARV
jgi:hypothetical protein